MALDLVRSNRPFGLEAGELVTIGVVNGMAILAPLLLVGAALAWVTRRPAIHAALFAAILVGWGFLGLSNQPDVGPRATLLFRLGGTVAAAAVFWTARRLLPERMLPRLLRFAAPLGVALLAGTLALCVAATRGEGEQRALLVEGDGSPFPPLDPPLVRAPHGGPVIVLGIDGLDRWMLAPLLARGELPHFERLEREGVAAVLETQIPTASPRIWTTVATGRSPDDHGVAGFDLVQYPRLGIQRLFATRALNFTRPVLDLVADGWRKPISTHERRVKAIWDLCSEAGMSVGVVGWWATWPAEPVNGFLVSDHAYYDELADKAWRAGYDVAGSQQAVHPAELLGELTPLRTPLDQATFADVDGFVRLDGEERERFGALVAERDRDQRRQALRTVTLAVLKDRFYGEAALRLHDARRPEALLAYLNAIDMFGHAFLGREDERFEGSIDAMVREVDRVLGLFLERLDDGATLVLLSDHGFREERGGRWGHDQGPPGVFFALGPHVRRGHRLAPQHVDDVAPTVLHLLGLPLSAELSGEPIADAFEPAFWSANPPREIPTYEAGPRRILLPSLPSEEDAAMLENLRALGYVK